MIFKHCHTMDIMNLRDVFIRNLKYYRKQKRLRQIDLAIELDKNPNYINSIENSKYFPSPETIEQIAHILQIDPMQLFNKEEPPIKASSRTDTKTIKAQLENAILKSIGRAFEELS